MSMKETPRVLSIQSHVVSGYVGNKSATFPLQLLGFEVDVINSVQLSNHTGYKVFKGQILDEKDLNELVKGLEENDLDNYTHLLTGYVGDPSFLNRIAQVVKSLKKKNPNLIYVCDPVMGDNGQMYVPASLKEIYKNEIVPLADILTPNHFELELLADVKINTMEELKVAVTKLHKSGPQIVCLSSTDIDNKLTSVLSSAKENTMVKIEVPKIPALYTGSGDLFAALFLAHAYLEKSSQSALEITISTLHEILLQTYDYSKNFKNDKAQKAQKIELRLIQSKSLIEKPSKKFSAIMF